MVLCIDLCFINLVGATSSGGRREEFRRDVPSR